jgi:stearoyl-CoA desaturase (delta-9 desaturase)
LYAEARASGEPLPIKQPIAKPSPEAQAEVPGASKVLLSSVYATPKVNLWLNRTWNSTDFQYAAFMVFLHGLALLAPMTFTWGNLALFFGTYFITGCLGITLSFHRQLSHRSFTTPKWLEYCLAYCGVLAVQGDPMEWVSSHRCVC